jgi:hypothetical protein
MLTSHLWSTQSCTAHFASFCAHMGSDSTTTRYITMDSHSSSSAIFERDIEPISFQSSHLRNTDPHHLSRAQAHEPVEQSVPSVLTSAVSALSLSSSTPASPAGGAYKRRSIYDDGEISVIAPAAAASTMNAMGNAMGQSLMLSGMATPRSVSRSPSPPATATIPSTSQSQQQQQMPTGTTSPASVLTGSVSRRSTSPRPLETATSPPPSAFKPTTGESSVEAGESNPIPTRGDSTSLSSPIGGFVVGSGPIPRTRPSQTSLVTSAGVPGDFVADEALASGSPNNRLSFISYHVSGRFKCCCLFWSAQPSTGLTLPS